MLFKFLFDTYECRTKIYIRNTVSSRRNKQKNCTLFNFHFKIIYLFLFRIFKIIIKNKNFLLIFYKVLIYLFKIGKHVICLLISL